jgi:hypothetical protein
MPFLMRELPGGLGLMLALRREIGLLPSLFQLAKFQLEQIIKDSHLDLIDSKHITRRYKPVSLEVQFTEQLKVIKELSLHVLDSLTALLLLELFCSPLFLLSLLPEALILLVHLPLMPC